MTWNAVFPTGPTFINQSVPQFQSNWAFLATNIGTDHYFNVGAPNEGHHQFSQYVNQAGDPALATDGVVYVKSNGAATIQPFYLNATAAQGVQQVPLFYTSTVVLPPGGPTATLNFAGKSHVTCLITGYQSGAQGNTFMFMVGWDGVNAVPTVIKLTPNITAITSTGAAVNLTIVAGATYVFQILNFYP